MSQRPLEFAGVHTFQLIVDTMARHSTTERTNAIILMPAVTVFGNRSESPTPFRQETSSPLETCLEKGMS